MQSKGNESGHPSSWKMDTLPNFVKNQCGSEPVGPFTDRSRFVIGSPRGLERGQSGGA